MGKKRIVTKKGQASGDKSKSQSFSSKKRVDSGILNIEATYNNTKAVLTDTKGNVVAKSSSGSLGFKGARKGTPFAAAKVGEDLASKAEAMGLKDVSVIIRGVGAGRESAMRAFVGKGFNLGSIKDETPVPFNGVKAKKARRV